MVEATKSRQTIFDFVLESPSSQFITTINLALLSITAFNPAGIDHDLSIGLNLSLIDFDHLIKPITNHSAASTSDLISHIGFRIQKTSNNPGRFTFSHIQV